MSRAGADFEDPEAHWKHMEYRKRANSPKLVAVEEQQVSNGQKIKGNRNNEAAQQGLTVRQEIPNMILLIVLYMMQGVPLGLTAGSMPFLLQAKTSYTEIGIFTVAGYPYSFKLLWSPIVDSVYNYTFGRRKSWIIPIQIMSAAMLIICADWAEEQLQLAHVEKITFLFFFLVLLAATQDIAVDGWALTLLSKGHVGYASTCQTIGMNIGYFLSFTVFLALNDPDFCNSYLRVEKQTVGIITLASYLKFWGCAFAIITIIVALFKSGPELQFGVQDGLLTEQENTTKNNKNNNQKQIGRAHV
eukprot:TRINITY_DN1256_c1_g2_i1.p2 TRINITY_DN1256_c1_g2~~TRINITY_DN1256_c1_g2_i1.p2  ORF type:complete len:302 (+),score=32.11 TRINITY_DN1256_c1_g2_i1:177-1082(+)